MLPLKNFYKVCASRGGFCCMDSHGVGFAGSDHLYG